MSPRAYSLSGGAWLIVGPGGERCVAPIADAHGQRADMLARTFRTWADDVERAIREVETVKVTP